MEPLDVHEELEVGVADVESSSHSVQVLLEDAVPQQELPSSGKLRHELFLELECFLEVCLELGATDLKLLLWVLVLVDLQQALFAQEMVPWEEVQEVAPDSVSHGSKLYPVEMQVVFSLQTLVLGGQVLGGLVDGILVEVRRLDGRVLGLVVHLVVAFVLVRGLELDGGFVLVRLVEVALLVVLHVAFEDARVLDFGPSWLTLTLNSGLPQGSQVWLMLIWTIFSHFFSQRGLHLGLQGFGGHGSGSGQGSMDGQGSGSGQVTGGGQGLTVVQVLTLGQCLDDGGLHGLLFGLHGFFLTDLGLQGGGGQGSQGGGGQGSHGGGGQGSHGGGGHGGHGGGGQGSHGGRHGGHGSQTGSSDSISDSSYSVLSDGSGSGTGLHLGTTRV